LLKHIYGLSDERVCERWVHDPYFQHFTGEAFFQHAFPHERSDLSHWRKRFGDKLELLLAESLRVAHDAGALRTRDLRRVTVDATVQPKAVTFPTDAKLLHTAINPYDGHTLGTVIDATEKLTGCPIERAYVDKGYRGHKTESPRRVFISGQKRGVFRARPSISDAFSPG
jgi:hypothetical protein